MDAIDADLEAVRGTLKGIQAQLHDCIQIQQELRDTAAFRLGWEQLRLREQLTHERQQAQLQYERDVERYRSSIGQLEKQITEHQSQIAQLQAEKREAVASFLAEKQRVKELDAQYQQLHQRLQQHSSDTTRQLKEQEQRAEERLAALQHNHAAELATVRGQVRQLEQQLTQFHATRSELLAQLHSKLQQPTPLSATSAAPSSAPATAAPSYTAPSPARAPPATPSRAQTKITAPQAPLTASAVVPPPSAYAALSTAPLSSVTRTGPQTSNASTPAHLRSAETDARNTSAAPHNFDDSFIAFRKRLNDLTEKMDVLAKQM